MTTEGRRKIKEAYDVMMGLVVVDEEKNPLLWADSGILLSQTPTKFCLGLQLYLSHTHTH